MKFIFDYAGLRFDKHAKWGSRTVEFAEQHSHRGLETTWLHGVVRSGLIQKGDFIVVSMQSGLLWLTEIVDFMAATTDSGFLDWCTGIGPSSAQIRFWLVLKGIPHEQALLCPGTGYGQGFEVQGFEVRTTQSQESGSHALKPD
jgi:hypothetical protein